jgi:BirA family biotin operon repressor/biotin-[acetyl-CoA-carboxylase] ligase
LENISPETLFVGQEIICLPSCESTNAVAQELLYKNEATEGTVVVTTAQTKGRGQRGNGWEAAPGQNITLSVVLLPRFLAVSQQFYLNMAVALAVLDFGLLFVPPDLLTVKWPNDLFFGNKKWGGILIENSVSGACLQHAVVGIGININQRQFQSPQAVSWAQITGKQFALPALTARLLEQLEKRYLELRQLQLEKLRHDYLRRLYRYQEPALFETGGQRVSGRILGVSESGQLAVQIEEQLRYFNFNEIAYLQ